MHESCMRRVARFALTYISASRCDRSGESHGNWDRASAVGGSRFPPRHAAHPCRPDQLYSPSSSPSRNLSLSLSLTLIPIVSYSRSRLYPPRAGSLPAALSCSFRDERSVRSAPIVSGNERTCIEDARRRERNVKSTRASTRGGKRPRRVQKVQQKGRATFPEFLSAAPRCRVLAERDEPKGGGGGKAEARKSRRDPALDGGPPPTRGAERSP